MEELIRKLTEAISDFNKYIKNEYSAINKNYSGIGNSLGDYSIYTIVSPKLNNFKINKTFPRANFIMVKINNSNDVVYLTTNTATKEKLQFRDGSRYEGIFSDLYLSYDFSSYGVLPQVQIFIGYNSKYIPITTVKIADVDTNNPLPVSVSEQKSQRYGVKGFSGNVNNSIAQISLPTTIDGRTVLGVSSILISNLDNSHEIYFGNIDSLTDINSCTPIGAGEKMSIDFSPFSVSFGFTLASTDDVNFQYTVQYVYGE